MVKCNCNWIFIGGLSTFYKSYERIPASSMKRLFSFSLTLFALLAVMFAFASCSSLPQEAPEDDYNVRVMISYPGDVVSCPTDTVFVKPGSDVYFPVTIKNDYEYVSNDMDAEYVNDVLILKDIYYPTTVTLSVEQKGIAQFLRTQDGGTTTAVSSEDGLIDFSESVTLLATPDEGYDFVGWTKGGYLLDQGTLVSTDPTYSAKLSAGDPIHANFKLKTDAIICYHLNGGTANGEKMDVYYDSFPLTYYHYPNAIADLGVFEKEGYTLLEYTENKDGSGLVTCPGGKIFMENDGFMNLWIQWEKWSPASFFDFKSGYITGYHGTEDVVTIPGEIGGETVVGIRNGAFNGAVAKTFVMHKNLTTIEAGAFQNCPNIETFYLHDSIKRISNNTFQQCNKFKNFRYNAATLPSRVSQSWAAYTRKFERAVYLAGPEHNLFAVLSGSSSLYSTDSPLLEELLLAGGYDFDVLNFGIQASCTQLFFMEFLYHFTDEGDVIIQAPEASSGGTLGTSISTTMMQVLQSTYNAFQYVDISKYSNLFNAIQETNKMREGGDTCSYTDARSDRVTINIYGDRENEHKTGNDPNYRPGSNTLSGQILSDNTIKEFNLMFRHFKGKGVRVYYSFATIAEGSFKAPPEKVTAYETRVDEKLNAPRISNLMDYVIPQEYMYNSDAHTNVEGMIIRTRQLARDILAQFEKEAKK